MSEVSQIGLMSDIQQMLSEKYPHIKLNTRQFNTIIQVASTLADSLNKPTQRSEEGMGITAWLASDDVGMSSKFMAPVLVPLPGVPEHAHPYDPSDFQRCRKLLLAVPELVERLPKMAEQSEIWAGLIENWDRISDLIDSGKSREAYEVIKSLR